jgi:metal-sulfur cluster biosynthetic enzyme
MNAISESGVWEALGGVLDPELGVDVVSLGLVYEVKLGGSTVALQMTLTSVGCPLREELEDQVKAAVGALPGVERVEVAWTFEPPWTPERMTEEGRDALISMGLL